MTGHHFATDAGLNAQFELLFEKYGIRGRMRGITKEQVRESFCMVMRQYPLAAVETAVWAIVNDRWPLHRDDDPDFLPSFAIICQAARHFADLEWERARGMLS